MRLKHSFVTLFIVIALSACGGSGGGYSASSVTPQRVTSAHHRSGSPTPIQHIVIMIQENRSFDSFFATYPGADGATYGYTHTGKKIALKEHSLPVADVNHDWSTFLDECDLQGGVCKMDGFDLAKINGNNKGGTYAYLYVNPDQIKPYWSIAQQYVLLDHMFQTQGSGSFTAHQDLIAGTTAINSTDSLIDYPTTSQDWGCDAIKGTTTHLISVDDVYEKYPGPFPCLNYPSGTMRDLLDAKQVSWKYYAPVYNPNKGGAGALWNGFAVIQAVRQGPEWATNISMPQTNIFKDITAGQLPAVSWVIPDQIDSDHPRSNSGTDDGPAWIASVVNAVGESSYWNSTAIVIVWDDWGGFFDNVPPKQYKSGELGFRVPALIVSPYVPAGKVAHSDFEFGSILKFVEQTFDLGSLHTTDFRAKSIGITFDFQNGPRSFTPIQASHSKEYFLKRPPSYEPVDSQ